MAMRKKRYRYGKIPFFHPLHFLELIFVIFLVVIFYHNKSATVIIGVIFLFFFYKQISPFFERFFIKLNSISIFYLIDKDEIVIPENTIFVLSYTDIFYSYRFKNRFMVNLVTGDVNSVLEELHTKPYLQEEIACKLGMGYKKMVYDNQFIEAVFKHRSIYSFVYDKDFAEKFFNEQKKTVILPRSLTDKIQIEPNGFEVIIDEER